VAARRPGPSNRPGLRVGRPRRGFVVLERPRPRFVELRRLADGSDAFYFCIPKYYRALGCEIANEPLGVSYEAACGEDGKGGRAATLNALFNEWNDQRKGAPIEQAKISRYGTIDWLFRQYKTEKAYTEKVSQRSRPDYERIMQLICDTVGRRIGDRQIREVTPRAADKIYDKIINGPNGVRLRQGEKVVGLCRKVWRIMRRLHPDLFDRKHPNPWDDFTLKSRTKGKKHAVTREEVYKFAWGCIKEGHPEPAAVAVICFEWLQRPENVVAGFLSWPDYRSKNWPHAVRIEHHKNKALVWHPLEEAVDGEIVKFYAEAEEILSHLPKLGVPMIMRRIERGERKGDAKVWSYPGMEKVVQQLRKKIDGVSTLFTLDACRHGGMTELEEAELTDGQGRALSGHKTAQAYRGYAKETMKRALAATRKRHAHLLAQKQVEQQNTDAAAASAHETNDDDTLRQPASTRRPASDHKDSPSRSVRCAASPPWHCLISRPDEMLTRRQAAGASRSAPRQPTIWRSRRVQ
jgi:hypothetical protein